MTSLPPSLIGQSDVPPAPSRLRTIFLSPVPFYVVVLLLVLMVGTAVISLAWFGQTIYQYQLFLPSGASDPSAQSLIYGSWPALSNTEFFGQVRDTFIADKANFIEADLAAMQLTVYQAGVSVLSVPILTKGKEGSWWETPAGLYRVNGREKEHFSSFGGVYMPWSLPFQGNFFIHGWPYYPDGSVVESKYSGGCIRLSTDDAKRVYDLVVVGTPVLVLSKGFEPDQVAYTIRTPDMTARQYLVADLKSNFVLLDRGTKEKVPIASITKLMTALVAIEYIGLDTNVRITPEMIVPTSKPRLTVGRFVTAYSLLFPLLMESSNEAAEALAQMIGRERFIRLMNDKASALGLVSTHFVDASGVGPENISTAEDVFNMLKYIQTNRSFILTMAAGRVERSGYGKPQFRDLLNFNEFGERPDFIGGKVGESVAAGQTMASVFMIKERPIAVIVLGSEANTAETLSLVDYVSTIYTVQ